MIVFYIKTPCVWDFILGSRTLSTSGCIKLFGQAKSCVTILILRNDVIVKERRRVNCMSSEFMWLIKSRLIRNFSLWICSDINHICSNISPVFYLVRVLFDCWIDFTGQQYTHPIRICNVVNSIVITSLAYDICIANRIERVNDIDL